MKAFAATLTLILGLTAPALAAGMGKPAEVGAYVKSAKPYGGGTLHKLFMTVYDTTLWTDAPRWSMEAPFALSIRYDMNFTTKELVDRSFEEIKRQGPVSPQEEQAYGPRLAQLFHDVRPGDEITAVWLPKKGAIVYYNGQKRGALADPAFARKFFNIWLGPDTSEPELRARLLGGK